MYFPGFQSISLWDKFITCVFPRFSICTFIEMKFITCVFPSFSICTSTGMKFILCVFPRFSNCTSIGMKFITCVFPNISIHMCISRKNWGVRRLYFKDELKFYLVVSVVSLEHELWHDLCEQNPQNEMFAVKIHTPNSDCYLLELFCCVF